MAKVSKDEQTEKTSSASTVRSKKAASESLPNLGRDSGIGSASDSAGNNPIGVSGTDWEGRFAILLTSFSGGILNRLMQQAQDQLDNANACIEWYEREKQRAEQAINELSELQSQLHPDESSE
jgi:outer membrane protein TolC